jgi:hypothetical protein
MWEGLVLLSMSADRIPRANDDTLPGSDPVVDAVGDLATDPEADLAGESASLAVLSPSAPGTPTCVPETSPEAELVGLAIK